MDIEQKNVVRHAAVFAFKLWLDSIKDIVLAFACLGAAAVDVLRSPSRRDDYLFYKVMRLGRRADAVIDLYGAERGRVPVSTP